MFKKSLKYVVLLVSVALIALMLTSCQPPEEIYADPYPILDNEANYDNKDHTTKDEAVERATGSLENLLDYLDSEVVSTTGYYMGADMVINTDDGSAFTLKLQANMYTWPYEQYEKGTPEYYEALDKHNELIKYNDLLLEWYDGSTNTLLIGFYFDGINPDPADPGNNLYLNLQGSKRIFADFGDTVFYQQMIRLITQLNLDKLISSISSDGSSGSAISSVENLLKTAVTTNYKLTLNRDVTSVFFNDIPLTLIAGDVTKFIQGIFSPFQDKLDPLTFKYLGFLFSTLGTATISSLNGDMRFLMQPNEQLGKEILTGLDVDFSGNSLVRKKNKLTGNHYVENVPFTTKIAVDYDIRVSQNIVLDREDYIPYEMGCYEFIGDMYLVPLDLKLDVLLRTDFNKYDNSTNEVYMAARDLATDDLIIGLFYKNELTYIDIEGLQHLYGGIKFEDIGLPKAYKGGFNLADTLMLFSDFMDNMIVLLVDQILEPKSEEGDSKYQETMNAIMGNIESTMKDEDDPASRSTIKLRVDMPIIKEVLKVRSDTGVNFTTDQVIEILNRALNIDLDEIASILGMSVEELLDRSYINITYDVDDYSIKIEVYSAAEKPKDAEASLVMRMDLFPTHIGEKVRIAFPKFDNFNELQDVLTYSGYLEGQFIFARTEEVNLSELLGAFMGDASGLNTQYILSEAADIHFTLSYDQYIREQILSNGRWTRKSRSAFNLYMYIVENDVITPMVRIYANDVSFNTAYPTEELGYIWLDYLCFPNIPKFKVREDLFITSLYEYMGYDFENETGDLVLGLTDIVLALMEDSWATFEPEVIRVTSSNDNLKQFFGVDELIGTISIMIGFKQRVKNIDQLEKDFAMYTVGTLPGITGESPYSIKLHESVPVYFDFGDRIEVRDFKFLYNEESIEVISGNMYYRPRMEKQFMGVSRDYLVYVDNIVGRQRIIRLVNNHYVWEPLDDVPEGVEAYYGLIEGPMSTYAADYNLHAIYNRETKYYTVVSPNGYHIVYDFENNVYIMGLGSQYKYDKGYEELGDAKVYLREFIGTNGLLHTYDLGTRIPGYYIVENDLGLHILYNDAQGHYVVLADEYALYEDEIAEGYTQKRRLVDVLLGTGAIIRQYTTTLQNKEMIYDMVTSRYMVTVQNENNTYNLFYEPQVNNYYIDPSLMGSISTLITLLGSSRIEIDTRLDYSKRPYSMVNWQGENIDNVDWNASLYDEFSYSFMDWEDITLEGGKYVVKVVVGEGMMATYIENVVVKVLNRTVLTELPYVNINTPEGSVQAPIAMTIEVDPIAYLIYKAYYVNGLRGSPDDFVKWYFGYHDVRIQFTKIYFDEEDTPDEYGAFIWLFDHIDENTIYSEKQINNYVGLDERVYTYVYTVFQKQIIALRLQVMPRHIDYFMMPGETEPNTYTVDSLLSYSYTIPIQPTFYYLGENGSTYNLDFSNLRESTIFSSKPDRMPNIGSALASANGKPIINWTHPIADNVKLVNDRDVNGNPYPFLSGIDNTTTSFLDFSINFDYAKTWYYEDWFYTPELLLHVNVPDKIIDTFEREMITDNHVADTYELQNIKTKPFYVNGELPSSTSDINLGVHNVDPFDSNTWVLPTNVMVFFTIDENIYQIFEYNVVWYNLVGDTAEHFVVDVDGIYRLVDVTKNPTAYYLEAIIGDDQVNYIPIRILVRIMSPVTSTVEFLNADNASLKDSTGKELLLATVPGTHEGSLQENLFTYYVDTYDRFDIPKILTITFKDGTIRSYEVIWSANTPWIVGSDHDLYATLGGKNTKDYIEHVFLKYEVADRSLHSLEIPRYEGDEDDLEISEDKKEIVIKGLVIDKEGYLLEGIGSTERLRIPKEDGSYLYKVTVYDYFKYLFGAIDARFVKRDFEEGGALILVEIKDAVTSAHAPIFGTVDLQKMLSEIHPDGQGLDIYIGQGKGAHDFTVYMIVETYDEEGANELQIDEDKDSYIIRIEGTTLGVALEPYNPDNTPKYPNGFIIADNLGFTVKYKDGTSIVYSNFAIGEGVRRVPTLWSVVSSPIEGIDPREEWMLGLSEFDIIDRLSEISIYSGGSIWLSAILDDGSRVYCRFYSLGINIGDNYDSLEGSGRYKINSGLITIENIYDHYSLGTNIIPSRLPSQLVLEGGFEISGISWVMKVTTEYLNSINYLGTNGEIVIAEARVMRETVKLRLKVLPCIVQQVSHIDNYPSRTLVSTTLDQDGDIYINFDVYYNAAYNGTIPLPRGLHFKYSTEGEPDRTFVYPSLEYISIGTGEERINTVYYNFNGHTLTVNGLAQDRRNLRFKLTLIDGQVINLVMHFCDKTVTGYKFENIDESIDKLIVLNPYSEYVEIPYEVTLKFVEGRDLVYNTEWNYPVDYAVRYDTYDTILKNKPEGQRYFLLSSLITEYELGYNQELTLKVAVLPYIIESWSLEGGKTDYYSASGDTHNPSPNATYHMLDPFAGKASHLPNEVVDILYNAGNLPIVWDFSDADIDAKGTPITYILVKGWIYDRDRGQPVSLKLYIDTWEFDIIRRPQGGAYETMMQDIRFYFSQVSGKSSYSTYEVALNVKDVTSSQSPQPRYIIFIPEDINPTTVKIAGTNEYYPADYPYRLKWDEGALARARNALSTGGDAAGNFSLANTNTAIVKIAPNNECFYQFETMNITKIDLGYGFGSQNEAIYVVDPLNPYFGEDYRLNINAKGNYNLESNVDLNSKGLNVTAIWWQTGNPPITIPDKYVGGGVFRGWSLTVRVENPQTGFTYQEVFRIMLVFLDMSPTTYINNSSMSVLNRGMIKTTYNVTTYLGVTNPYEDAYMSTLLANTVNRDGVIDNILNTAIRDYSLIGVTIDYTVTEWDPNILINNNMHTQYSKKVSIRGKEYTTNIVRRQYSSKFEITGLDLGYGMGIDSARHDYLSNDPYTLPTEDKTIFIVNPLEPNFASQGATPTANPYVFHLNESRVIGNYEGEPFEPGQFTFDITWWNSNTMGSLVFKEDVALGGYIDHWKVTITVMSSGNTVLYTQVYNILLFFLDGRNATEMEILYHSQNSLIMPPKTEYKLDDYTENNPYGDYYTQDLRNSLSSLASVVYASKNFVYDVLTWGPSEEIEGYIYQYSQLVRIYRMGADPQDPNTWVITTAQPFIVRKYQAP